MCRLKIPIYTDDELEGIAQKFLKSRLYGMYDGRAFRVEHVIESSSMKYFLCVD